MTLLILSDTVSPWTAASPIIAFSAMVFTVLFSTWNVFGKWIAEHYLRPLLAITPDEIRRHSSFFGSNYIIRVPIWNLDARRPRSSATEAEIFLDSIKLESGSFHFEEPSFLPVRLKWTHSPNEAPPVCDRISKGCCRLLDFGQLVPTSAITTGTAEEIVAATIGEHGHTRLVFSAEVPGAEVALPPGRYLVGLRFCCEQTSKLEFFRITIHDTSLHLRRSFQEYLTLIHVPTCY